MRELDPLRREADPRLDLIAREVPDRPIRHPQAHMRPRGRSTSSGNPSSNASRRWTTLWSDPAGWMPKRRVTRSNPASPHPAPSQSITPVSLTAATQHVAGVKVLVDDVVARHPLVVLRADLANPPLQLGGSRPNRRNGSCRQ